MRCFRAQATNEYILTNLMIPVKQGPNVLESWDDPIQYDRSIFHLLFLTHEAELVPISSCHPIFVIMIFIGLNTSASFGSFIHQNMRRAKSKNNSVPCRRVHPHGELQSGISRNVIQCEHMGGQGFCLSTRLISKGPLVWFVQKLDSIVFHASNTASRKPLGSSNSLLRCGTFI